MSLQEDIPEPSSQSTLVDSQNLSNDQNIDTLNEIKPLESKSNLENKIRASGKQPTLECTTEIDSSNFIEDTSDATSSLIPSGENSVRDAPIITSSASTSLLNEESSGLRNRFNPKAEEDKIAQSALESNVSANDNSRENEFACNICFEVATDPVLTVCGHLFCWQCLGQWLQRNLTCPVCKAGCEKDTVIPVYGRGKEEKDPRKNITFGERPAGQRPAVPARLNQQVFGWDPFGMGIGMTGSGSTGGLQVGTNVVGLFPGFVGFTYTFQGRSNYNTPILSSQSFLIRLFIMIMIFIFITIFFD